MEENNDCHNEWLAACEWHLDLFSHHTIPEQRRKQTLMSELKKSLQPGYSRPPLNFHATDPTLLGSFYFFMMIKKDFTNENKPT